MSPGGKHDSTEVDMVLEKPRVLNLDLKVTRRRLSSAGSYEEALFCTGQNLVTRKPQSLPREQHTSSHKDTPLPTRPYLKHIKTTTSGLSKRHPQNTTGYCYCSWSFPRGRRQVSITEDLMYFRYNAKSPMELE